jgi:hypothetical protein
MTLQIGREALGPIRSHMSSVLAKYTVLFIATALGKYSALEV